MTDRRRGWWFRCRAGSENPPPPPCWDASINNCPVGGALRFTAPKYAMVGVPVTMYAYASWRPDANSSYPANERHRSYTCGW